MSVKERLIQYLNYKGISKSNFGRAIGVSSAYVTSMRKSIDMDKVKIIAQNFPDLNIEWLLYEEGEMLKNSGNIIQGNVTGGAVQSGGNNHNVNISLPSEGEQKIIRPDGTVEVQKSDSNYTKLLEQRVEDLERIIKSKDEMIDLLKQFNNK